MPREVVARRSDQSSEASALVDVTDLAAMPGSPGTVAVCRIAGTFNSSTSLSVYDDAVKRPNDSGSGADIELCVPANVTLPRIVPPAVTDTTS